MKILDYRQGTAEWLHARAGLCTASEFKNAVSILQRASGGRAAGEPSSDALKYAADLAIERISCKPWGEPIKAWALERGHALEDDARRIYQARHKKFVTEFGLVTDDESKFGYSTDGLLNDENGLIEIKCPVSSMKILDMWANGDVSEYIHQMQGGMWLTGRKYCDLIMYVPDLKPAGKDLFVKRVFRDDDFIDAMVLQLHKFQIMVEENVKILTQEKE
ncbi:MAG: YqaJ viral recombinase family protein [Alphaproteobacteria bacterium]|nr:YqaJ viral recombinase family protein [Alphaproteobacteria bacterium]